MLKIIFNSKIIIFLNAFILFFSLPIYGFHSKTCVPFRYASGGGRELHFIDDLTEFVHTPLAKLPLEICI